MATAKELLELSVEDLGRRAVELKATLMQDNLKLATSAFKLAAAKLPVMTRIVGRAELTCREWCRHVRIIAQKKASGRGAHACWVISNAELLRYQREGLLRPRPAANPVPAV